MDGAGEARRAAKAALAAVIHYSGARRAMSGAARIAAGGRRSLILAYHRVVEDFEAESKRAIPGLLVSRATFERQLDELERRGYEVVSLATLLDVLAGVREARRDLAVLTFDDGYRDVFEVAFPVLKARGLTATVYLPTAFIGSSERLPHDRLFHLLGLWSARPAATSKAAADPWALALAKGPEAAVDRVLGGWPRRQVLAMITSLEERLGVRTDAIGGALLDWEMCREMSRQGIGFGAHTVHHAALHLEGPAQLEREVRASRAAIEERLGVPCRDFAYPNGYHGRAVVRALIRAGFRSSVTTEDTPNALGGDPFLLRRKTLWEHHSRGLTRYSSALTACQLDGIFGMLGLTRAISGSRAEQASA